MGIIIVVSVAVWLIIKYTVEKDNISDKIFNWLGVVFNVLEYFPIGFDIIYIIKNKISEKFTLFGAFFGLFNSTAWLAWAVKSYIDGANLMHSIVANCLGICLTLGQFVIFFVFRKYTIDDNISEGEKPIDIDNDKGSEQKNEINEPEYITEFM